jgi:RHS repeat-associated protein
MTTTGSQQGKSNPLRQRTWRPLPWPMRGIIWALVAVQTMLPITPQMMARAATVTQPVTAQSQFATPPPAPVVTVNRTVPDVKPPSVDLQFSANPTDEEISRARVFSGPIVSIGKTTSAENSDLAQALLNYRNRQDPDDASAIENFLQQHPGSSRYISLSAGLAAHYRSTSQFSKALAQWQQIWSSGKDIADVNGCQIVDQAVGEWATLLVTLGRKSELTALLQGLKGRELHGAAAVRIADAESAIWQMEQQPKKTFKCGPYSLSRIQNALDPHTPMHTEVLNEPSTTNGTSLYQNWLLAQKMGLKYQMARRQAGAEIPLPAMVHWKLGHFSALIKMQGGYYRIEDPTFAEGWVSPKVLDEEADCFLIPEGPLPSGWSAVTQEEGETIFGRSTPVSGDLNSPTTHNPCPHGMASYWVGLMRISLTLGDIPLSYIPPRGPSVDFEVTYAERSVYETGPFTHSNLGNQWGFGWMQYISDNTTMSNAAVELVFGNGNAYTFTGFNTNNATYAVEPNSQAQLTKTSSTNYQCLYPDGSIEIYSQPDNTNGARRVFMTEKIDPQGNALTFTYDSTFRLIHVTDAIGQVTTLTYGLSSDTNKITIVTDPFGRFATFQYNSSGQLTNITDTIGINSAFTYGAVNEADFINSLTTPYGITTFTNNNANFSTFTSTNFSGRWIQVTDPLGAQERYEFTQKPPFISDSDPANLIPTDLNPNNLTMGSPEQSSRMSFFWDKTAMAAMQGTLDYTKARQYLWDRLNGSYYTLSSTLEAVKQPLESARVWYNYPGQTKSDLEGGVINKPSIIARVLDDGTTQAKQFQFNSIGRPLLAVDPSNRTNLFTYAVNNIDLLTVAQLAGSATNILGQFTYNSQHLPLTAVDAAGNMTYFGYNTNGQLIAMTNALNETVLLNYNTNGYLTNIIAGTTTSQLSTNYFTYDGYGRVRTATDPLGYTLTTCYDAADRPTNITYMDGTYQQIVYNYLDPVLTRDRAGHWTSMAYDQLRHLTDSYDNLGRHTQFGWCGCGSLTSITDPLGRVTTWVRDLQSRVQTKVYPDNSQITYAYEANSSRLHSVTDENNQTTLYSYFIDNNLKQVNYSNAVVATPPVSFTYDTNYNRITTMTDGTGVTTYNYYNVASGQLGAGMLSSVSNSFIGASSVIAYNYDALGRITNRAINGVSQQIVFDALHRVTMVTNVLGNFTNTFIGGTMLLSTNFYPNGQKTVFSYLSIINDERVSEIWNQNTTNGTLSKFDYAYDPIGNITNWTEQADANAATVYNYGYDSGNQVISAVLNSTGVGATVLKQYAYGYDLAGNRTGEQIGTGTSTNGPVAISQSGYNNVNQITNRVGGSGSMQFAGIVSKQATVTVGGNPATINHATTNFTGYATVSLGTNVVPVIANDYSGNSTTNKYLLVVTNNGLAKTITYDLNGNETSVVTTTSTNTYQWDAANRVVSISGPTNQSQFTYDGFGRRVQIIELTNGVAYATNKFVWDRKSLCEQRDLTGANITKRFFGEGEQVSGTNYLFTRDRLGSVREVMNFAGVMQARYDYDPYGRPIVVAGSFMADFGYTGMYYHPASGLNLTLYRAYNSDLGRWLSRDPIQELGGLNLYDYVANNPINFYDAYGLAEIEVRSTGNSYVTDPLNTPEGPGNNAAGLLSLIDPNQGPDDPCGPSVAWSISEAIQEWQDSNQPPPTPEQFAWDMQQLTRQGPGPWIGPPRPPDATPPNPAKNSPPSFWGPPDLGVNSPPTTASSPST